jgi:hypothetical protein
MMKSAAYYASELLNQLNADFEDRAEYKDALDEVISAFQTALDAANEEDLPETESEEEKEDEFEEEDNLDDEDEDDDDDDDTVETELEEDKEEEKK